MNNEALTQISNRIAATTFCPEEIGLDIIQCSRTESGCIDCWYNALASIGKMKKLIAKYEIEGHKKEEND
ncbi:MAG: hypothetical protein Q8910_00575 [Bacteroidota bacterium]|nr:hypothetical protein [Bacteroidota bacterium]